MLDLCLSSVQQCLECCCWCLLLMCSPSVGGKKRTKKKNFVLFYLHLHFFSGRPKQNVTSAYLHLSAALWSTELAEINYFHLFVFFLISPKHARAHKIRCRPWSKELRRSAQVALAQRAAYLTQACSKRYFYKPEPLNWKVEPSLNNHMALHNKLW